MTTNVQHPRKTPLRSCVACRTTTDKRTLVRFVRTTEGEIHCDPTGKQAGRGAYLCDGWQCFERARKGHLLDRALRAKLDESDYARLKNDYAALCGGEALIDQRVHREDMV